MVFKQRAALDRSRALRARLSLGYNPGGNDKSSDEEEDKEDLVPLKLSPEKIKPKRGRPKKNVETHPCSIPLQYSERISTQESCEGFVLLWLPPWRWPLMAVVSFQRRGEIPFTAMLCG